MNFISLIKFPPIDKVRTLSAHPKFITLIKFVFERCIADILELYQITRPSRSSRISRNLRESPQNLREWPLQLRRETGYNGRIKNTTVNGGYDHETEKAPCPRPCGRADADPAHRLFRRRKRRGQARRGGRRRHLQGKLPKRRSLLQRPAPFGPRSPRTGS